MEEGLGFLAVWRGWREAEVVSPFAGEAALTASRRRATSATALTTAAASGAIQRAPAFLLNLAFLVDRVVDAAIQAETGDFFGVLIGRRHRTETVFG